MQMLEVFIVQEIEHGKSQEQEATYHVLPNDKDKRAKPLQSVARALEEYIDDIEINSDTTAIQITVYLSSDDRYLKV